MELVSFWEYLVEAVSEDKLEYGLDNDSKGKMHEVLTAAFLKSGRHSKSGASQLIEDPNHLAHGTIDKLKFPEHFRSEEEDKEGRLRKAGEAPEELYERLRTSGGPGGRALTDVEMKHHWEKARTAAAEIMRQETEERASQGLPPRRIKHVHWTSNPTDIEKLTGIDGAKNTSDIAITWDDGEKHGKSLKVGKKSTPPTLANPGKKNLHSIVNADLEKDHPDREPDEASTWDNETAAYRQKSLDRIIKKHGKQHGLVYDKKTRTVYEKESGKPVGQKRIREIEKANSDTQEQNRADAASGCERIATRLHKHFSRMQGKDPMLIAKALQKLAQSETGKSKMRVDRVQTTGELGSFKSKSVNPHDEMRDTIRMHGKNMTIRRTKNTLYFQGLKNVTIATLQIKPKSSGGFTAPIGVLNGIKGKSKETEALSTPKTASKRRLIEPSHTEVQRAAAAQHAGVSGDFATMSGRITSSRPSRIQQPIKSKPVVKKKTLKEEVQLTDFMTYMQQKSRR